MGQANQRGTFEQRQAEAIERRETEDRRREAVRLERKAREEAQRRAAEPVREPRRPQPGQHSAFGRRHVSRPLAMGIALAALTTLPGK